MSRSNVREAVLALLVERDGAICGICRRSLDGFNPDIDHIQPLSAGGSNLLVNLQLAHKTCNSRKGGVRILKPRSPGRLRVLPKVESPDDEDHGSSMLTREDVIYIEARMDEWDRMERQQKRAASRVD